MRRPSSDYIFLKAKEEAREFDEDYGDVSYNRACYHCLLWTRTHDQQHKERAYLDLEKSIKYDSLCKRYAKTDPDFEPIWDEERFKQITDASPAQTAEVNGFS